MVLAHINGARAATVLTICSLRALHTNRLMHRQINNAARHSATRVLAATRSEMGMERNVGIGLFLARVLAYQAKYIA